MFDRGSVHGHDERLAVAGPDDEPVDEWKDDEAPDVGTEQWAATQRTPGLTFTQRYPEVLYYVNKRKRRLDLATLPWEDIRQLILIRVSEQYEKPGAAFDPAKGPFKKWLNRVITNAVRNIWRDNLSHFSRPCITGKGGCVENMGGDLCRRTSSGKQCAECPAFRKWEKRKGGHNAVRLTLSMENHSQEVSNVSSDFLDVAAKKRVIDARIKGKLTKQEWRIYSLLMIKGKSEEETAKALGFRAKRGQKTKMFPGYLIILAARHRFVAATREIIRDEDLA